VLSVWVSRFSAAIHLYFVRPTLFVAVACALAASCGRDTFEPPAARDDAGSAATRDAGAEPPGARDGEIARDASGESADDVVFPGSSDGAEERNDAGNDAGEGRDEGAGEMDAADAAPATGLRILAGAPGGYGHADDFGTLARFNAPAGLVPDGEGNLYVAETSGTVIRKVVLATGQVTTIAGRAEISWPDPKSVDGVGAEARFRLAWGLALDGATLYVTDRNLVRKVDVTTGRVTTLAGSIERHGNVDGIGASATFDYLEGAALDGAGNLYVADSSQQTIRKIVLATNEVSTFAGSPKLAGWVDGKGSAARFSSPMGVAAGGDGNLYVADSTWGTIRRIDLATGGVYTVPGAREGDGVGFVEHIAGLAADRAGSLYYTSRDHRIRKLTLATGSVLTMAGSGDQGSTDGVGLAANFSLLVWGLATDGPGRLYVSDTYNHAIRRIDTATAVVTTPVGLPSGEGSDDGVGGAARFQFPSHVAADGAGHVYVADSGGYTIRTITVATGEVTTLAGSPGKFDAIDGIGSEARPGSPWELVADGRGSLFVTDRSNSRVLRVATGTGEVTTLAGGTYGAEDGIGKAAQFVVPQGITLDGAGNLYIADAESHTIRKIAIDTAEVTTLAGKPGEPGAADGTGSAARFDYPSGVAHDGKGHLYVSETGNHTIRVIATGTGEVTTLMGSPGVAGYADGAKEDARFNEPWGLALDGAGHLLVADAGNHAIRRIDLATGTVTTPIGTPDRAGVKVGVLPGSLNRPMGVAIMPDGQIAIAESTENVILLARPALTSR
jgi:sugar lactone lactonase YvrE